MDDRRSRIRVHATLLDAKVKSIYTTDAHFELYTGRGVEIVNLAK